MKKLLLLSFFVYSLSTGAQVPNTWTATGIGGGGSLFAPTINPVNNNEFYISSDLSAMYHTTDGGLSYDILNGQQIQGFHYSTVCFTSTPNLLYSISYANNNVVPVSSTDNGLTWNALANAPMTGDDYTTIFVDYAIPTHIVLGYYGEIFFSKDGGNTFSSVHTAVNNGAGCIIGGVFFDGNNVYIGTNDGIVFTTTGNIPFSVMTATGIPSTQALYSFAGAKSGDTTRFFCQAGLLANVYNGLLGSDYYGLIAGVYTMDNASGTWVPKMTGINTSADYVVFTAMATNDINTCYLAGGSSAGAPDVMKTTNGGASWTHVFNTTNNQNVITGWCGSGGDKAWSWAESPFGLAVAPNNSSVALFGDYSMVTRTINGGTSWEQAYVNPADEHAAGAATPTKKKYHSIGMENTTCWQVYWVDSLNMYGAYTDIFAIRSMDAGNSWSFNYGYTPSNTIYHITHNVSTPTTLYAATSTVHDMYQSYRLTDNVIDVGTGKIIFSPDGGAMWTDMHNFNAPVYWVATDPEHPDVAYASVIKFAGGTGGIYVCNNLSAGAASTWTELAAPPRTQGHPATIEVLSNGKVLCSFSGRRASNAFTASAGIFLYNPTTTSWTDVSAPQLEYYTRSVTVDPNDATAQTWYACVFSGYGGNGNGDGGVYKTTNGGTSWTKIFTQGDVFSCTISPTNPDLMYVCTDGVGLWTSSNINAATPTFSIVSSYPFANPIRVSFNPYKPNEPWIGTFGYGMNIGSTSTSTTVQKLQVSSSMLQVYPNPSQGEFEVNLNSISGASSIDVRDITGKIIMPLKNIPVGETNYHLDLKNIPQGLYILSVYSENNVSHSKLIIQ